MKTWHLVAWILGGVVVCVVIWYLCFRKTNAPLCGPKKVTFNDTATIIIEGTLWNPNNNVFYLKVGRKMYLLNLQAERYINIPHNMPVQVMGYFTQGSSAISVSSMVYLSTSAT